MDSRVQSLNLVSESGLYDLIMQSRKPEAKAFKRWVTHEVLPSIRKTGGHHIGNILDDDELQADSTIKDSLIVQTEGNREVSREVKQYRMHVANLFGFEAKVIVTNPKDIKDPRSTWWCLADAGIAIGSSRSGSLLGLLHRRERDSRIFTNDEIILGNFKGNESLPLANRGQTFVSLSGFLEILSKTELSSDKIDDFQEEIFGRVPRP